MNKSVKVNFLYLTLLQVINYVLPVVIIPFLIIKLGTEGFGIISFALATVTFFRVITSYGFDLTASREISIHREDKQKIASVFSVVLLARALLGIVCFILLLILIYIIPSIKDNAIVFLLTFLVVFGDILFPVWFFQGIEDMKYITIFRVMYKLIYSILVVVFVDNPSDVILVPLFDGLGSIISGMFSLVYIRSKFNVELIIPSISDIKDTYKKGYDVFLSKIMVVFYSSFNTFLLGVIVSPLIVGYYSVAERVYLAVRGLLNPFIQAIFPYLSRLYLKDSDEYELVERKITYKLFCVLVLLSICMYFSSDYLHLVLREEVSETTLMCLKIFSLTTVLAMGGYFSSLLITKGKGSRLRIITTKTVIFNMIIIYPLILYYEAIGAAICFLMVQLFHLALQIKERRHDKKNS
ncbi:TPA: flippase [Vibrio vulnificus]|uniref:flippase n=1 Tax=Vibrio vulnificus TaxID=672 RepID=UPI0028794F77|nr:flippase [Vibrio vulnificus]EIE1227920.1 flippase [Vibrio vulnificus]MDS1832128.1 flippase [Vibrio vulnificus]